MVAESLNPESKQWVRDIVPPMPDEVRLELAGLDDFDTLFHMVTGTLEAAIRAEQLERSFALHGQYFKGTARVGMLVAASLERLGFHR